MTTQAKHTPGPWQHVRHGGYEFLWANGGKCPLGVTFQRIAGLPADMQEANARLIAAAPDLLEALRGAVGYAEMEGGFCDPPAWYIFAKNAIDRAEGRAGE